MATMSPEVRKDVTKIIGTTGPNGIRPTVFQAWNNIMAAIETTTDMVGKMHS